jgi:hypothetical protein
MLIAAMSWPEAVVGSVSIVMLGFVLSVAVWQIFRTGQTAIRKDGAHRELVESIRSDVEDLRSRLDQRDDDVRPAS